MTAYYDFPYELMDAIEKTLRDAGVEDHIASGGKFADRNDSHIYIDMPQSNEAPPRSAAYMVTGIIGVATLKDVSLEDHRAKVNQVFNIVRSTSFKAAITENSDRIACNQIGVDTVMRIGELADSIRYTELEITFRIYAK